MAAGGPGRQQALEDMFRVSHNTPSTPPRGLTGEVRERTIWAYWAQGYDRMPEFFKLCVGTWQRHNPHWDVRILEKATVHEYLSEAELPNRFMHMFSHQAASDAVRLGLLSRYGGVYMDVNILMRASLDAMCWDAIASGERAAAVFYHPHYGTEAFDGKDLTESWFLATRPGNPFFLQWRDLFKELMHNRLDTEGLLEHPLYQGVDLSGIDRLNKQFGADFDFREYLAIHAMCHRLIETDEEAHAQWSSTFRRFNAAETAFRVQLQAEAAGRFAAEAFISTDPQMDLWLHGVPLIKFTTPHHGPLAPLTREQLLDKRTLLGRLLDPPAAPPAGGGGSGSGRGTTRPAFRSAGANALGGSARRASGAVAGLLAGNRFSTLVHRSAQPAASSRHRGDGVRASFGEAGAAAMAAKLRPHLLQPARPGLAMPTAAFTLQGFAAPRLPCLACTHIPGIAWSRSNVVAAFVAATAVMASLVASATAMGPRS